METTKLYDNCINCGRVLIGRAGKKFCCPQCRSDNYNKEYEKRRYSAYMRTVSNILLRNRKILAEILPTGESAKTSKNKLTRMGFNFKYHTNVHSTGLGRTVIYCYDYGYILLEDDWYLIVKNKEDE
jgi:predicted RNA-binding Zn-ribbon protein involved in translation (DUF1610 family)